MENSVRFEDEVDTNNKLDDTDMRTKVQELLDRIGQLENEKQQVREEFGIQRAKMKDMYLQKEEELKRESAEHNRLRTEVKRLNTELDDAKSEVMVAGMRVECEQEVERKFQEEIATLQQLVQETLEESSSSRSKFENEVKNLRAINDRLKSEIQEVCSQVQQGASDRGDRDSPILAPGVMLSAVTKTFARKVVSQLGADSSNLSQDNLEDSMRKVNKYAQEDAEVLRSLVIPLEEEIQALKEKLRFTDHQLRRYQGDKEDYTSQEAGDIPGREIVAVEVVNSEHIEEVSPSKSIPSVNLLRSEGSQDSNVDSDLQQIISSSQRTTVTINSVASVSSLNELQTGGMCKSSSESHTPTYDESLKSLSESVIEKENECAGASSYQGTTVQSAPVISSNSSPKSQQILALCDMCSNYEAQLVKSQQHARDLEKQLGAQERTLQRCREDLVKESDFRKEMEEKWNEKKDEHKIQVTELQKKMECAEAALNELRQTYSQTITQVTDQLMRLSQDREKVEKELLRLQNENDNLVGKHSAHSQQLQNEMINLPDKVEDLHELLLKFHEELIAAKVAKEAVEEQEKTLRCEILLLRDQMSVEQEGRDSMEDNLTTELELLKKQLGVCERDRRINQEKQEKLEPIIEQNKCVVAELQVQLSDAHKTKNSLEDAVAELRSRVGSLQQELDNAEAVQQDFVRLSQSLQVELQKIRDADSQVRWQHEDDIEECPVCRNHFSVTRRKQHCRHCGRIFCTNCLSHTVLSGPNQRPSRVCDVCHTLLVKDTAPYFSTEPPHTPD